MDINILIQWTPLLPAGVIEGTYIQDGYFRWIWWFFFYLPTYLVFNSYISLGDWVTPNIISELLYHPELYSNKYSLVGDPWKYYYDKHDHHHTNKWITYHLVDKFREFSNFFNILDYLIPCSIYFAIYTFIFWEGVEWITIPEELYQWMFQNERYWIHKRARRRYFKESLIKNVGRKNWFMLLGWIPYAIYAYYFQHVSHEHVILEYNPGVFIDEARYLDPNHPDFYNPY